MMDIISQLNILDYLNVLLIMMLVAFGFIIKHVFTNVPNQYIPLVLFVTSILYSLISLTSYTKVTVINAIVDAIISAAIAIGLHSGGKRILRTFLKLKTSDEAAEEIDELLEDDSDEDSNENG